MTSLSAQILGENHYTHMIIILIYDLHLHFHLIAVKPSGHISFVEKRPAAIIIVDFLYDG